MMNLIVVDLETTGVDITKDEILQISLTDGQKNVLLDTYCKPDTITEWKEAEAIHGITPKMVQDKPSFHAFASKVQEILSSADRILSYNGVEFDLPILQRYGISYDKTKCFDLYTEALKYYHRSFKLVELVQFYGLQVSDAHNATGDNFMLLDSYYRFMKEKWNSFYHNRTIDWILHNLDHKVIDKAVPISKEGATIDLSFFGRTAELSGLKLNTLRDSIRCSEVTVDNSNTRGGIVDFMRFEEYYTIEGEKRLCSLNWRAKADYCEKGLGKGERRKYCDQTSCRFNYAVDTEVNHYLHTAIEIKVTLADFKSKHGHNFVGNLNYYAIPGHLLSEVEALVPEDIGIILYQDGLLIEHKKPVYHELTLEEQLVRTVCILKASRTGRNQEHNKTVYQY